LYLNVPTIAERAYPGFQALSWVGISALKEVPKKSEIDQWVSLIKKSGIKPESLVLDVVQGVRSRKNYFGQFFLASLSRFIIL
jgi:hypothetical protein